MAAPYRFYLSLENSVCEDFYPRAWIALSSGMVPIISTKKQPYSHLPKHSYIDMDTFKSIRDLAKYLKSLESNRIEYEKYFAWRSEVVLINFRTDIFFFTYIWYYSLCEKLHTDNSNKVYTKPSKQSSYFPIGKCTS